MWHPITSVAASRFMDKTKLDEFARVNVDRFHIVNEYGYNEISTWYVDAFIAAAQESGIKRLDSN